MLRTISLDELLALNHEIAALARVGAPLEPGLRAFAQESPGRLAAVAEQLSQRLASGQSLASAAGNLPGVPPIYSAVLEAGARSGRLPAALESLADMARRLNQLRRVALLALAYPVIVLLFTYQLLLFFLLKIAPSLAKGLNDTSTPSSVADFFLTLTRVGQWLDNWSWLPPILLICGVGLWWWRASRSLIVEPSAALRWLGWVPWFGPLLRDSQLAVFTETLALLVEHGRPLPESVTLAAQVTGRRRLMRAASQASQAVERGEPPAAALRKCGLPPLVSWLLSASTTPTDLAGTLRAIANDYQQRAAYQAEKINLFLPVILTAGIAGVAVALYALMLFLPWTTALRELAGP